MCIVLGFIAEIGGGKSQAANYVSELYPDSQTIAFSTPLRGLLTDFNLPVSRENLIFWSEVLRKHLGQYILGNYVLRQIYPKKNYIKLRPKSLADITQQEKSAIEGILQDLNLAHSTLKQLTSGLNRYFRDDLLSNQSVLAVNAEHRQSKANQRLIIADGIRRDPDWEALEQIPSFWPVAIEANPEVRYSRTISRNQNSGDQSKSYSSFITEGQSETERDIRNLMSRAKIIIHNNGSQSEFKHKIKELITGIKT